MKIVISEWTVDDDTYIHILQVLNVNFNILLKKKYSLYVRNIRVYTNKDFSDLENVHILVLFCPFQTLPNDIPTTT